MEKLTFNVIVLKNEKFFRLQGEHMILLIDKIISVWFEGYFNSTKCKIIRNDLVYDSGYVMYHGTHAASEYFFGFSKIEMRLSGKMTNLLQAKNLEYGDILEIENLKKENCRFYESSDSFITQVASFHGISQTINDAFKEGDGRINKEELLTAALTGFKLGTEALKKSPLLIRLKD
ncbi:hypothetical protein KKB58_02515 [Patescibacteria group bacterium]|nr:hypothetical protein [Patescibacteria group bacterium]